MLKCNFDKYGTTITKHIDISSNSIVEMSSNTGLVTKTINTNAFNSPLAYCTMATTPDGQYIFFTAYMDFGTTPMICRVHLSDSTGDCLSKFDPNDSMNPREFALISSDEIYLSITVLSGVTTSGIKYRISYSNGTIKWKSTFVSSTSNDSQGLSSCLYSASTNSIFSLTVFNNSNNVVLFILDASNGNPKASPYRFNTIITKTSGIICINSSLYFVLVNSTNSFLVVFNTSSQSFVTYAFISSITITKIRLTLDKLIFIGSDATYAYRSKVTSIQFGYDSDIISSTFTMVDASSAYHITAQLSTQFLTQIGVTFTALALTPSGVSLLLVSSMDSDISFSCDSVSDLTLVTDTINIIPLSLSCSISDSISISYQLQSNPSWITIDIDKREIIANTVGIPVGTTATFTINSISNYPICDKTVNLKIVSCSVQNCKVCNSNNPNSCQTCSDWYTTKQDASSNTVCIEYSSISGSISSISSTTTQSMIGAVAGTSILFSFCNLSTFQGIWITVNQFQLILLLLLTNSHIPKSIVSYLSGLKETTCSLNFIPFKKVYGFKWITDWLDFHIENSDLEYFGITSGSTFVNNFSLICILILICIIHLFFLALNKIVKNKMNLNSRCVKVFNKVYQLLSFTVYLRLIMLTYMFIMLSCVQELKSRKTSNSSNITSFICAVIIFILCIIIFIISLIHWKRNKGLESTDHYMPLKEFFNNIKDQSRARLYSTLILGRRAILVIFIIMCSSFNSIVITIAPFIVGQFIYLCIIIVMRPQKSIKDNILEITNEIFYFVMVTLLSHYNSSSKWTGAAESAYFYLIVANSFAIVLIMISAIMIQVCNKAILKLKRNSVTPQLQNQSVQAQEMQTYEFRNFKFVRKEKSELSISKNTLAYNAAEVRRSDVSYYKPNKQDPSQRNSNVKVLTEESKISKYWNNYYQ